MLRTRHDVVQIAQTNLKLVALHAHRLLFLTRNRQIDLDDRDRLVRLADLILRMLGEVPTHRSKPLLCLLLIRRERIHTLNRLRNALLQLCQTRPRFIHLIARILIDVKDLRLIVLDRVDCTRQQPAQLPLLKPLHDLLRLQLRAHTSPLLTRHRPLLHTVMRLLYPISP